MLVSLEAAVLFMCSINDWQSTFCKPWTADDLAIVQPNSRGNSSLYQNQTCGINLLYHIAEMKLQEI